MIQIKSVKLETVCGVTSTIPKNLHPEFAFAGKSNVGKSTLINGLMNRKAYARTSAAPGKTQTINFYHINDAFYFVDLPGYGYAKRSKTEVARWGKMVEGYLKKTRQLRVMFLLIDMRHEPNANDRQMYDWMLYEGVSPVIVATKADKIKKSAFARQVALLRQSLALPEETPLIPYSGLTKQGREEIYTVLEAYLENGKGGKLP